MNTSRKDDNISVVTSKLIGLILKMPLEDRRRLLTEVERNHEGQRNFIRRKHDRQDYMIHIDYMVSDRLYNGFAINLSANGAFIESPKNFLPNFSQGDQVILSFEHPTKQEHMKITGEVARIDKAGIGVMFDQAVLDWWTA
jgi:Tfp pilus assembly protein PilZ